MTYENHRRACAGFTAVVDAVPVDGWSRPTPCADWDARGVVEHVIGFHDVLVLRPLDAKPHRPRDDVPARWRLTADALAALTGEPPDVLPALTTDVLIHTWDLARALGVEPALDRELCVAAYESMRVHADGLAPSGMFGSRVTVADDADVVGQLIALSGRDPAWAPTS